MKKGMLMLGEIILLIIVLVVVRIILRNISPDLADNDIVNFILYFISGMGGCLIYRMNNKNTV